nr:hypothetical protein Cbor_391 [Cedratvirus borely]
MSYTSNPANFYSRSNLSRGQGFAYPGSVNRTTQGAFVNGTQGVATSRNNYGYSNNTSYRNNSAGYGTNQGYRTAYGNGTSSSASTCPCARGRR